MYLSQDLSNRIVCAAKNYLGRPFDWDTFNCVHFVRQIFAETGIDLPLLNRNTLPPAEFHLSGEEFALMPIGHSVFFKRRESKIDRSWSHLAIIAGPDELIHCTRHLGSGVIITSKARFMELYKLTPKYL